MVDDSNNQEHEERERGILTPADRAFLHGEKEDLAEQSKRDARYRIRKRTRDGLIDLGTIYEHLDDDDRQLVFEELEDDERSIVFHGGIALLFRGLVDIADSISEATSQFETFIESAITRSILRIDDDYLVDLEVDIDLDYYQPDLDELKRKYELGEESPEEFYYLLRKEEIERDAEFAKRHLRHMHNEGEMTDESEVGFGIEEGDEEPTMTVSFDDYDDFERFLEAVEQAWNETANETEEE